MNNRLNHKGKYISLLSNLARENVEITGMKRMALFFCKKISISGLLLLLMGTIYSSIK